MGSEATDIGSPSKASGLDHITDDKAGMQVQARGVASTLGVRSESQGGFRQRGVWRFLAPYKRLILPGRRGKRVLEAALA
ncbi:MAG: hypothetical protein R3D67_02210 [Hyphomicrobiaceae bacterium]